MSARTIGEVIDLALAEGRPIPQLLRRMLWEPWRCLVCGWEGLITELLVGRPPADLDCPRCGSSRVDLAAHSAPRLRVIQGGRR
jgi:predicted RNA-binding Zn-ribbon protein involved in translation (DUF1610 family)